MESYKVTLFSNVCPKPEEKIGGVFVNILRNQLESKGVEVDICCKRKEGILSYGEYYKDSVDYLKRNRSDIMQVEQFPHSCLIPSIFNNKYNGTSSYKMLTRFHGFTDSAFGNFGVNRELQQYCIDASNGIVSVSPLVSDYLYNQYNVKSHLNPAIGIDTDKFKPMNMYDAMDKCGLDNNKNYMIYVGRNSRGKNVGNLIMTAMILKKEYDIDTIVIGDRINSKYIQNIGYVDNDMLPYYYNSAMFMCYPSMNEGFGVAIAECLACAVPVIMQIDVGFLSWFKDVKKCGRDINSVFFKYLTPSNFIYEFDYKYKHNHLKMMRNDVKNWSLSLHVDSVLEQLDDRLDNFKDKKDVNEYIKNKFGVDRVIDDLMKIHKHTLDGDEICKGGDL